MINSCRLEPLVLPRLQGLICPSDSPLYAYFPNECRRVAFYTSDREREFAASCFHFSGREIFDLLSSRSDIEYVSFNDGVEFKTEDLVEQI